MKTIEVTRLTGYSLSICVLHILEGHVREEDVDAIESATRALDVEQFKEVLEAYAESYWRKDPEKAKRIAWQFWAEGKIHQPRLYDDEYASPTQKWAVHF